ncbi:hypothetical protein GWO43_10335, partial [candidate division KSB1 bacterium]|nr:hypothetical protein [candidate division KSB1 bacterium]NIT71272.1 hypothetical protein [candidate division KSB1 bacterium]NIW44975.1 hypothetical protein [Gammaproteobacteria bacterium]NIW69369.1 hypothetical protein [candidate division KSB1 bacterium]NIX70952.1 hypothetical protein [candidate division KSB1 bacterium]
SDEQEMDLIASGLADETGGVMTGLQMAANSLDSSFYAFGKVNLDTSIIHRWMSANLELHFFALDGSEVPIYIPGLVDSLTCDVALSGDTTYASPSGTQGNWGISLNTISSLYAKQFATDTVRISGTGVDSSQHVHHGNSTMTIDSHSPFTINNVIVPLSGTNRYPASGTVDGSVAGTVSSGELTKDISIPYNAVFNDNGTVTVTLTDSGKQFTVNLETGEVTEL